MVATENSRNQHPIRGRAGRCAGARGFTLVEMLVVIGIIVVLVGLAMVAVHAARSKADQARIAADFQSISTALDAYKADFGDYPRLAENRKFAVPPDLTNPTLLSGAELLCWALVGPYDIAASSDYNTAIASNPANPNPRFVIPTPPGTIQTIIPGDGADGSGFRTNAGGRGQVYPSYLNVERFKIARHPGYERYMAILDSQSMPILYYATSVRRGGAGWAALVDRNPAATWDFRDNEVAFWRNGDMNPALPVFRMRAVLGDRNNNGTIDAGETAPATPPYLLWSAGPDAQYGPADPSAADGASQVNNCDDVTNIK